LVLVMPYLLGIVRMSVEMLESRTWWTAAIIFQGQLEHQYSLFRISASTTTLPPHYIKEWEKLTPCCTKLLFSWTWCHSKAWGSKHCET
jgi:hypothetical protein